MIARRDLLVKSSALGAATVLLHPAASLAQTDPLAVLTRAYAKGGPIREGRVAIDIATIVDNGNSVPITVSVQSPMKADDRVVGIAIFNEKNPQPEVAEFALGPRAGLAEPILLATKDRVCSCYVHGCLPPSLPAAADRKPDPRVSFRQL